ncbi:MAG: hypothetical protein ACR2IE_05405 [Candidatus Sumerlaeaceae bacterium]
MRPKLNRRRWIGIALLLGCFGMLCVAAQLLRGIKPAEHLRGLLLMTWMLVGISGMITGMVLVLAGKNPRWSIQDSEVNDKALSTNTEK